MIKENLHIAMIMDGNRRWAVANGKNKLLGHKAGAEKLKEVIKWCVDIKSRALTLYTFSTENFNRSKEEIESLFKLFRSYFKDLLESKEVTENNIKIKFLGKLDMFPDDLRQQMLEANEKTKDHSGLNLNFCVAYGGHQEIIDAVNKILKLGKESITEEEFEDYLYLKDQPDLVIRTGGAVRLSNFLSWQTAYSEWFFVDDYWPGLTKETFDGILEQFQERQRNFGK
ncbi:di-trans,poly-cis-decaprenylcistransferase [Candidatus Woesearchaeota archaeon]|nr:di-trans,poly-cis-decaprenylcistransferase [Candidatus Woesearchaeota archaeon]